jgi:DNA-binding transcriptional MerR regulator
MTVNEVAREAGVPAHVVRYYTRAGLLKPRRDPDNHYRLYTPADLTRLRFIRRAKLLGFTLGDVSQILRDADRRRSPCPRARTIITTRLRESDRQLSALLALQQRMGKAVKAWKKLPDAVPNGDSICRLIEAVTDDVVLGRSGA